MVLSGRQFEELQNALIDAFIDKVNLEQMLLFGLDKKLRAIADQGNLKDIIFKLIQTANTEGWVEDLACAAYNHNSGNQLLQRFIQKISLKKSIDLRMLIEKRLEDEYDNLEELGMGAFGITYRANLKDQSRDIVIKTIKIDELFQIIKNNNQETKKEFDQAIRAFSQEAEFLSNFKHQYIVRYENHLTEKFKLVINHKQDKNLYSVYELDLPFLVMEYIEGENLEDLINKRNFPLGETEALHYIQQIGEALIVVHDRGLLHRDIKPKNIIVQKDRNDAVLIDFGIAREFSPNITQTQTVAFTQGYAPPEQLNPKAQRGKYTDIYGLAATLYYLLTQKHPIHVLNRITQSLDEPKNLNPHISDRVNKAIIWGMEVEASKRPQTVQEWLKQLFARKFLGLKTELFEFDTARLIVKETGVGGKEKNYEIQLSRGSVECFRENLGNGVILEMIAIPGGEFLMGSPENELGRHNDEGPQHNVIVQPFFMGKYQITQEQYEQVIGKNPSYFKGVKKPVECVSWNEAVEFCAILSKSSGHDYRLPSEAEWEYACRAGTSTPFYFGETITTELANYRGTDWDYKGKIYPGSYGSGPKGKYRQQTTDVGIFPPNVFGLIA